MTATMPAKAPRRPASASARRRVVLFARAVEASVKGEAPEAARLWRAGWNKTDRGDLNFTPNSAKYVMAAWEKRGNPLVWYYEHEDELPLEKRGGAPMRGAASAPSSVLAIRQSPDGPECWAEQIAWTAEARRQIVTGERRQLSPIAAYDKDTREILEVINVSLCSEGATHHGTLLASAQKGPSMNDLVQKLLDALNAGDFETAENIVQQMESAEGGEMMGQMGRAMLEKSKPAAAPDAPPASEEEATKKLAAAIERIVDAKLAASRPAPRAAAPAQPPASLFASERAAMLTATESAKRAEKDARKATVELLIATKRDLFDTVDEREHIAAANPEATRRHIASLERKREAGVIAASKPAGATPPANPPKDPPKPPTPADDLTEGDKIAIESFNRGKPADKQITASDFLASKHKQSTAPTPAGRKAN